ncbi:MAG: N-6 DNA methylase, partial [Kordiimonadaceae bacterium]|nr:N-6 DNA methylase [Kordiimonadaceae bacterium]
LSQEELLRQTVYIQHRPLKDPRDIKMLDPACGSMHFGLYAFDLFEKIYIEAWDLEEAGSYEKFVSDASVGSKRQSLCQSYETKERFLADVPRLIIEHNIHGVDIDPRAVQVAGLSLWLRAQKSWSDNAISPNNRPLIQRSNIVCAESMPGEKELLKEFTSQIQPCVLGQLITEIFEKMELAGEAGTLLKIEEEIESVIAEAKKEWEKITLKAKDKRGDELLFTQSVLDETKNIPIQQGSLDLSDIADAQFWEQAEHLIMVELERYAASTTSEGSSKKRLFASDAAKGFAFIDLCRKRFDVVLMNPPFGECSPKTEEYLNLKYGKPSARAIYAPFISRANALTLENGLVGALSARGAYFLSTYDSWRQQLTENNQITTFIDLGYGIFEGPKIEIVCIILRKKIDNSIDSSAMFIRLLDVKDKEGLLRRCVNGDEETITRIFSHHTSSFTSIPTSPFAYWYPDKFYGLFKNWMPLKSDIFVTCQGMSTTDDFRYMRLREEIVEHAEWPLIAKGGEYATYYSSLDMRINWGENGRDLKGNKKAVLRNHTHYFKSGITWTEGTTSCFSSRYLPDGSAISGSGQGIYSLSDNTSEVIFGLLGYLNSRLSHVIIESMVSSGDFSRADGVVRHYSTDLIGRVPIPSLETLNKIIEPAKKLHTIQEKISSLLNYQEDDLLIVV